MAPHIPENMVLIPKTIFAEPLQAALRKMASAGRLNFSPRKSTKGGWEGAVCLSVHGDLCP